MLTHRTNLLLSDEEFELISRESVNQAASIGEVIRKAIRQVYGSTQESRGSDVFSDFLEAVQNASFKDTTASQLYEDRTIGRK